MKITVDVDATPEELREFLGMPDVKPIQDEMLSRLREHLKQGGLGFDPGAMLKPLLSGNVESLESWQKALWSAFAKNLQATDSAAEDQDERGKGGGGKRSSST